MYCVAIKANIYALIVELDFQRTFYLKKLWHEFFEINDFIVHPCNCVLCSHKSKYLRPNRWTWFPTYFLLKESLTRVFWLQVFSWINFLLAPEYPIGKITNFYENSRRYLCCSSVSLLPAINYSCSSAVNTIPAIIYRRCQQHRRWNTCNKISLPTPNVSNK